ncbi:hypothetical protein C1Y40_01678 [Mycobacterium talmoniae]|uniref:Uncharacterized protein n=1 Tax=Mycobacterium talmoniae TaxID=1858794 RepID=A0A2S8BN51_9MYCO|nr:hypothetical protein C1Y40_01678 [Mycobacterium talmoniae]
MVTSTVVSVEATSSPIRCRSRSTPSPVCADTNTASGSARRSCANAKSPAASILLTTNSSGTD